MNNFTRIVKESVIKTINDYKMLENTKEIVVGFSGGADSVCLLHVLKSFEGILGYSLKAVHINHGIRGEEANSDELFAEEFCKKNDIPFESFRFDCVLEAKKSKQTIEECGRRLRYETFSKVCGEYSKIATAHNANDNAETMIFNIVRGTSVKGLCGIPFTRDNIIRPLLNCSRKDIEAYCDENQLGYVVDSTNEDVEYTRNKIRHLILPVLEEINPKYVSSFNSLSCNAKEVSDFISANTEKLLSASKIGDFTYNRSILLKSDKTIVSQLLYSEFLKYSGLALDNKKIKSLYSLLHAGGRLQLYGAFFAEVKKDFLRFYENENDFTSDIIDISAFPFVSEFGDYHITLEKNTESSKIINQIDSSNVIDCNMLSGKLILRTRKPGDSFTFPKRNVSKTLKKLFTEENIPIEIRNKLPVICDDEGVVWVMGFGVTKRCLASKYSDNIILVRGKNNDR